MTMAVNIRFHRWRQPSILRQFPCLQAGFQPILILHLHGLARDMVKSLRGKGYGSIYFWRGLMEK